MSKKHKALVAVFLIVLVGLIALFLSNADSFAILNPKGEVADKQRNLIVLTSLMSILIVVPVFIMTFYFAWKYREDNKKAKYEPDWDHSAIAETVWWTVPLILILILAGITWQSSHELDPFKPLDSAKQQMTIQVVALDWKWLFIYPDQQIASLNYVQFPEQTPVRFEITSDAPMNSFWIPQLGGQIYAMSGMSTHLNLMADGPGTYRGSSANLSGRGFAGMRFEAESTSQAEFASWVAKARQSSSQLTQSEYDVLALPSENNAPAVFSYVDPRLYDTIVMKYMMPGMTQSEAEMSEAQ